jgi:release factor glutamine methyltransferase
MTTVYDWLIKAKERLSSSEYFEDDINLTLKFLLESRLHFSFPLLSQNLLSKEDQTQLDSDLEELSNGKPLPHIIGEWSFYGEDFIITSDVLIPRPETELMIEEALNWLLHIPEDAQPVVYDIGTGSGIIAITIAKHLTSALIIASDISTSALSICEKNIAFHELSAKITTCLADGLPKIDDKIDLLCANLPYIPSKTVDALRVRLHEPRIALDGGEDGMHIIKKVIADSVNRMKQHSLLLFEIEAGQGQLAVSVATNYYPHSTITIMQDLSGKNRLLRIENK